MSFTPEIALGWTLIVSLALCLVLGTVLVSGSFWRMLSWTKLTGIVLSGLVIFAILGIVLLTSPKWSQLALKLSEFEATISKLESENSAIRTQLAIAEAKNNLSEYVKTAKAWKPADPEVFAKTMAAALRETTSLSVNDEKMKAILAKLNSAGMTPFVQTTQLPLDPDKLSGVLLQGITPTGWAELTTQGAIDVKYRELQQ